MVRKSRFSDSKNKFFHKSYIVNKKGKIFENPNYRKLNLNIKGLRYCEPVDHDDLKNISKFLKRTLNIWSKERILLSIGKKSNKSKIDVEYVKNDLRNTDDSIGHYTLKGKREPKIGGPLYPNNCFFNVVASQTGIEPNYLRGVAKRMKTKSKKTCNIKKCLSHFKRRLPILGQVDLRGGAQYTGEGHKDAKKILDSSQQGKSHPYGDPGHPRGHASNPEATGTTSSVENYSKTGRDKLKTGFLSPHDQDIVAHLVLDHDDAQDVMDLLNELKEEGLKEAVKIRARDLNIDEDNLPDIQEWSDGKKIGEPAGISSIVMVLKHFYERSKVEKADVFVLTFYPKL